MPSKNNKIVCFGELLLRLTPPGHRRLMQSDSLQMHWAGSEANVAVSLATLGEAAAYVTRLPAGELGRSGLSQLRRHGVDVGLVQTGEGRLGTYYYESGAGINPGRVYYDRDHSAFSTLQTGQIPWAAVFENASWFHWSGITPALTAGLAAVCGEASMEATRQGLTVSADLNYRSTLWNYGRSPAEVMPPLLREASVIVADINASGLYLGVRPDPQDEIASTFRQLNKALTHARYLAMTTRTAAQGAAFTYTGYLFTEGKLYSSPPFVIGDVVERIGTGDAFMAALIFGVRKGWPPEEVIAFATAAASLKHAIPGDFNIFGEEEIRSVMSAGAGGRVIR